MGQSILAHLVAAGIVERAGARGRAHLRVTPRFMAHAEGTRGRLRMQGQETAGLRLLEHAVGTWDDLCVDPRAGARMLQQLLGDREQWGTLRPVFPDLGSFQMDTPVAA